MDNDISPVYADRDSAEFAIVHRNVRSVGCLVVGAHFIHCNSEWGPIVVRLGNGRAASLLRQVAQPEQRIGAQRAFRRFRSTGLPGRYRSDPSSHLFRSDLPSSAAEPVAAIAFLAPSH